MHAYACICAIFMQYITTIWTKVVTQAPNLKFVHLAPRSISAVDFYAWSEQALHEIEIGICAHKHQSGAKILTPGAARRPVF